MFPRKSNLIIASIAALTLGACASQAPINQSRLPDVAVPEAQPVVMQGYTWKVYKSAEIQTLADDLKAHPRKDFVIFAMTPNGYQKLNNDYGELNRYIQEQKAIIVYLKKEISDRAPVPDSK